MTEKSIVHRLFPTFVLAFHGAISRLRHCAASLNSYWFWVALGAHAAMHELWLVAVHTVDRFPIMLDLFFDCWCPFSLVPITVLASVLILRHRVESILWDTARVVAGIIGAEMLILVQRPFDHSDPEGLSIVFGALFVAVITPIVLVIFVATVLVRKRKESATID